MSTTRAARVALLQLRAFSIEDAEASLAYTMARIDEAAERKHPDIVVLPEMTYPAYFLGSRKPPDVLSPSEAIARFAEKAHQHSIYIAAGLALDAPDGGYTNGAALFARDGSLAGRYDKCLLWHFDRRWFAPGAAYPVFETDVGRIGMLVCADGRMPEIARSLMLNGAQLILDLTAWVSGARRAEDLTTSQFKYLMRVRAAENGIWIACADKCGIEAESIVYAGRSCVIDPRGTVVAQLGPEEEGMLVYDVPLTDASPRVERRPRLYEALTAPTDSLPVLRTLDEALPPAQAEHRIAVAQLTMPPDGTAFLEMARRHAERERLMETEVLVFPATPSRLRGAYDHDAVLAGVQRIAADTGACIAFTVSEPDADGWRAMYLVGPHGVIAKHRQTHKPPGRRFETMPLGDEVCAVVQTPFGRAGLLVAAECFVPEVARSLMLRGAEVLLCCADAPGFSVTVMARTRAEENRIFVACASAPTAEGGALIAGSDGSVLATALEGRELVVGASINRTLAHIKQRAPGTDIVRARQPGTYGAITREPVPAEPVL